MLMSSGKTRVWHAFAGDRHVTLTTRHAPRHVKPNTRKGIMGTVMIDCPDTGRAVSTGIEMLSIEPLPMVTATTVCPVCGRLHRWTKDDAWLAKDGEQYRAITANG
jgi:hypothetical protein